MKPSVSGDLHDASSWIFASVLSFVILATEGALAVLLLVPRISSEGK